MDNFVIGDRVMITDRSGGGCRIQYPGPLTKGDRVRIKGGYDGAGLVYFYKGNHLHDSGIVNLTASPTDGSQTTLACLAEAIEPYPYTREERIERAIEDYLFVLGVNGLSETLRSVDHAILFAILDAGI